MSEFSHVPWLTFAAKHHAAAQLLLSTGAWCCQSISRARRVLSSKPTAYMLLPWAPSSKPGRCRSMVQTNRQMLHHFIDPALHTVRTHTPV